MYWSVIAPALLTLPPSMAVVCCEAHDYRDVGGRAKQDARAEDAQERRMVIIKYDLVIKIEYVRRDVSAAQIKFYLIS